MCWYFNILYLWHEICMFLMINRYKIPIVSAFDASYKTIDHIKMKIIFPERPRRGKTHEVQLTPHKCSVMCGVMCGV